MALAWEDEHLETLTQSIDLTRCMTKSIQSSPTAYPRSRYRDVGHE